MSVFAAAVEAALQKRTVNMAYGAVFDFASGAMALWEGRGDRDGAAFSLPVFKGLGRIAKIGSVDLGVAQITTPLTFVLSGLDTALAAVAANQSSEVRGRRARLYLIVADAATNELLGMDIVRTVRMDRMTVDIKGSASPPSMAITLTANPILQEKNKAPLSMASDEDQRRRHPGDRGWERRQLLTTRQTLIWGQN